MFTGPIEKRLKALTKSKIAQAEKTHAQVCARIDVDVQENIKKAKVQGEEEKNKSAEVAIRNVLNKLFPLG